MAKHRIKVPVSELGPLDPKSEAVRVIIETPKGSRNKFKFNPGLGLFELGSVLPAGAVFPFDFGFIPGTKAEDGDPLDVLLFLDVPTFCGCLVMTRLIGVIEAEQTDGDGMCRNDRLVAVASDSEDNKDLKSLKDVNDHLLGEIEHFFISYNESRGKKFKLLVHRGPSRAHKLLEKHLVKGRSNGRARKS